MRPTLRIIRPSSREQKDLLPPRLAELKTLGFDVLYEDLPPDPAWAYASAPVADRARAVEAALTETESQFVLAARGGYGASDVLPHLDWQRLAAARPKVLVGFSDISALHSALYARLGWPSLHAPMPATALWRKDGADADVDQLLEGLRQLHERGEASGAVDLSPVSPDAPESLSGPLFGGCFTVLTNLIATPYFPRSLEGHIVFIEDTDEHPARLMRAFNQWVQSGTLAGVRALVLGHFRNLGDKIPDGAEFVHRQFAGRAGVPVYHTPLFGHTSPNFPLMIGADAQVAAGRLTWRLSV